MFVVAVNMVVIVLLLAISHSWLGRRVERLITQTELCADEQQSKIADFRASMTDLPVPGDHP